MLVDTDLESNVDLDLELDDGEARDQDIFEEYDLEDGGFVEQNVNFTMEVEMDPVFLLIHHIEVNIVI